MAKVRVVRTEEKSKAHLTHYLSDGRYITEDRRSLVAASTWRRHRRSGSSWSGL